jgi:hypothetical protein
MINYSSLLKKRNDGRKNPSCDFECASVLSWFGKLQAPIMNTCETAATDGTD